MIRGKKGLQDHIFAILTHIIANFRRSAIIFSGISTVFSARLKRRGYESICDLGEVMRWKNQYCANYRKVLPFSTKRFAACCEFNLILAQL